MKSPVLAAIVVVLALSGCAGSTGTPDVAAPTTAPTAAAPTATPTPTPTASESETPSAPPSASAASADCTNLLDDETVQDYTAQGLGPSGSDWKKKVLKEAKDDAKIGLAAFDKYGGIFCGWSDAYENRTIFGYGPITKAQQADAIAALSEAGYSKKSGSFEKYTDDGAEYAFGDGYWAFQYDNGAGEILNEIVANAPVF